MTPETRHYDFVVIGGGFYGCCLALFLRSVSASVLLVEAEDAFMTRASRVNQARIHAGFHYPRSFITAARSAALSERFARDFPEAVVRDFRMLYAIARRGSKISAGRFFRMFTALHAPIRPASEMQRALFDADRVEEVFECGEYAFDYTVLRRLLAARIAGAGIEVRMKTRAGELRERPGEVVIALSDGTAVRTPQVFNVTYAQINHVLEAGGLPPAPMKHEFTEIALIEPPAALAGLAVTLMDGPFFSAMPYPAEGLYSLTHVRYTPHSSWTGTAGPPVQAESRARHMLQDAQRFLPCLREARPVKSLYETKSVLLMNERDDGRPILFRRKPGTSRVTSVMGGKIDNIYDLFVLLKRSGPAWQAAHDGFVRGVPAGPAAA